MPLNRVFYSENLFHQAHGTILTVYRLTVVLDCIHFQIRVSTYFKFQIVISLLKVHFGESFKKEVTNGN
jgi:hypothetical protein